MLIKVKLGDKLIALKVITDYQAHKKVNGSPKYVIGPVVDAWPVEDSCPYPMVNFDMDKYKFLDVPETIPMVKQLLLDRFMAQGMRKDKGIQYIRDFLNDQSIEEPTQVEDIPAIDAVEEPEPPLNYAAMEKKQLFGLAIGEGVIDATQVTYPSITKAQLLELFNKE